MLHDVSDGDRGRPRDPRQTVDQHAAARLTNLVDEVKGIIEIREQFLAEVVVDGDPHEVGLLHEVRLGAGHAHVQLVQDVVVRKELFVVGVVLRSEIEKGQDASGSHVRDGKARLGLGGQGRALLARVLAQLRESRLELEETASQEVDGGESAPELVEEHVQERVLGNGGE